MKKPKNKDKQERLIRRRNLAKCIKLIQDSQYSHLADASGSNKEEVEFNARTISEYGFVISVLSFELFLLAKQDYEALFDDRGVRLKGGK